MSSSPPLQPRIIYWFRTDLRLHDSPALQAALDLHPEVLYPIWTWDPHYVYQARVGPNRFQFLIDCQNNLSESLTKLNFDQKLLVLRESPQTILPKLFKAWNITHLVFEKDTDAYARQRDEEVIRLAKHAGVGVVVGLGRTLYDPDLLVLKNGGRPTMSITQVMNAGKKIGPIPRPIPPPTTLPSPGNTSISSIIPTRPSPHPDLNAPHRHTSDSSYSSLAGPTGDFSVPDLSELGMSGLATTPHRGGETLALSSLDKIISNETYTATFQKPNTAPTAFHPQSTTLLSPHLHFGSLSIRTFYWAVQDVVDRFNNPPPGVPKKKEKASTPPTSLIGQLLFRDMYFGAQAPLGFHFGQTQGNSHCRFIPWHLQTIYSPHTGLSTGEYTIDSPIYETWFLRWKFGMTGYPFIDALMRQLKQEGWIHHLGRHAVACFLTRGGCYIDWMRGAEVFEEWLIDHETAANIGNWQWLSCTAFFSMFYRIYSPVAFGRKWDPKGSFVRRYVKELEGYPDKWIYEPWLCPKVEQEKAGCRVVEFEEGVHLNGVRDVGVAGKDEGEKPVPGTYPKPMFDFPTRRTICLEGMKKAYKVGLYGNDPRVKDGTWRDLFPDEGVEGFSKEMTGTVKSHEDDALDDDDEEKKNNKTIEEENEDAVSDPGTGMRITDVKAGMKRRRRGREGSVSGDEYMKETETKRIQGRGTKVGTGAGNNGAAIAGKKKMGKQFEKGDKKQMTLDALVSSLSTSTAAAAPAAGRDSSSGTRISERLKKRS